MPKIILFRDNFIWYTKESIIVLFHLPGGHKIRTNGETIEDIMPALVKQQKHIDVHRLQSYKSDIQTSMVLN